MSLSLAVVEQPHVPGCAASGDEAALSTLTKNPLLPLRLNWNTLAIHLDGTFVEASIDMGAHVSFMTLDFCRCMKNVLTPPLTNVVRFAYGATVPVVGMCSAQLIVAGHQVVVPFTVLATCLHYPVLGLHLSPTSQTYVPILLQ